MVRRAGRLEGRSGAPAISEAYDRSIERLHAIDPARVRFGHDRGPGDEPGLT